MSRKETLLRQEIGSIKSLFPHLAGWGEEWEWRVAENRHEGSSKEIKYVIKLDCSDVAKLKICQKITGL